MTKILSSKYSAIIGVFLIVVTGIALMPKVDVENIFSEIKTDQKNSEYYTKLSEGLEKYGVDEKSTFGKIVIYCLTMAVENQEQTADKKKMAAYNCINEKIQENKKELIEEFLNNKNNNKNELLNQFNLKMDVV